LYAAPFAVAIAPARIVRRKLPRASTASVAPTAAALSNAINAAAPPAKVKHPHWR
jgi:hypothetical protein